MKHDGYYYVEILYALEWKNDHYYLIGFSLKHQKIAYFRVDRLTGVETLETCFIPIEGFSLSLHTNKMVDMFTSESSKEVTLVCENELMRVIIDHYGEDIPVEKYDDAHFTARIEVNPSGTFYGWIFKFKGKIKIHPQKSALHKCSKLLMNLYSAKEVLLIFNTSFIHEIFTLELNSCSIYNISKMFAVRRTNERWMPWAI